MSKPQGIFRPLGLALVLAIGCGTVLGLAVAWGVSIWESLRERDHVNEFLVVRGDGTPLIQRYMSYDYQTVTFHTLEGDNAPAPKENETWLQAAYLPVPRSNEISMFPSGGNARIGRFSDGERRPKLWYFIDDGARNGHGYFVGYDSQSKLCAGFIGLQGLRSDRPPAEEWFPMDGVKLADNMAFARHAMGPYWSNYGYGAQSDEFPTWKVDMLSGNKLLQVNLRTGAVTTLVESADMLAVGILETASKSKTADEESPVIHRRQHLAVRTTDRVLVFNAPGKQPVAFQLPEEFRDRSFSFYELEDGRAFVATGRTLPGRNSQEELARIDASGNIVWRAEVTLGKGNPHYDENEAWVSAFIVPTPLVLAFLATVVMPLELKGQGLAPNYSTALAHSLAAWWPALLVITLLATALAWYCFRRHRRCCQSFGGVWLVFVFLLGVPGLVGYLFHRRWPVLERCPACGHEVPRDRETCARCGAAFPPPEPKGCEVFA